MIVLFFTGVIIFCLVGYAYIRFRPKGANSKILLGYDFAVLLAAILSAVGITYHRYREMQGETDAAWWPVVSMFWCIVIVPAIFIAAGLLRNFVIFRPEK